MGTTPRPSSYPHDLVGRPADPPEPVDQELVDAWRAHEADQLAALEPADTSLKGAAAQNWRMAGALEVGLAEANATNPNRDRSSDGGVGNAAHQKEGRASDHNPWVVVAGVGVVRARDFDVDGLDVPAAFERLRLGVLAGRLPQFAGGGYLIHAGRITAEDWAGWHEYTGPNPHVTHGHVSVSLAASRFDDRRAWGVWSPSSPTVPHPAPPAPTTPAGWTGPDLTGSGLGLRADAPAGGQINGPRTAALQDWWRTRYPAYGRNIAVDGWWGDQTTAVCFEFARRSGIRSADGRNIGPQIARQLYLAGFRG